MVCQISFVSAGPKLWNSLPDDITSDSSLTVCGQKLKTHLLNTLLNFATLLSHIAYQILIKLACVLGHTSSAFMSHVSCITV